VEATSTTSKLTLDRVLEDNSTTADPCSILKPINNCGLDGKCAGHGVCQRTKQYCTEALNIVEYSCFCDSLWTGVGCATKDTVTRNYACGGDHRCGGKGLCTLVETSLGVEYYKCRCNEGWAGHTCHHRRADSIKPTAGDNDLRKVMAGYGGYFDFRQLQPKQT